MTLEELQMLKEGIEETLPKDWDKMVFILEREIKLKTMDPRKEDKNDPLPNSR